MVVVAVAALAIGCGESSSDRGEGAPVETPSSSPSEGEPTSPATSPPTTPAAGRVEVAVADLATRLGIEPAAVEVVSVEEVTWRDGSLGCAQPGMAYTQALVAGSRIVLRADGAEHEYHQGGSKPPFRCAKPTQ
ncbi:hypothetical protein ASG88_17175 [Nocardioides sp. Soil777]|nr:hypothetical protein ASG88_17175 [Nocardioides sp. Soil777]